MSVHFSDAALPGSGPGDEPFPAYDAAHYEATQSVGHQLYTLMVLMRRAVESRMAAHDLTDAQWKPLWVLKSGKVNTAQEMARWADVDPAAVTRTIDRLVAKGLVERVRSETDRRVVHLRLTPAGDAAVAVVPQVLASVNNDFLAGFSRAEWLQLRGLLARMTENGAGLPAGEAAA